MATGGIGHVFKCLPNIGNWIWTLLKAGELPRLVQKRGGGESWVRKEPSIYSITLIDGGQQGIQSIQRQARYALDAKSTFRLQFMTSFHVAKLNHFAFAINNHQQLEFLHSYVLTCFFEYGGYFYRSPFIILCQLEHHPRTIKHTKSPWGKFSACKHHSATF